MDLVPADWGMKDYSNCRLTNAFKERLQSWLLNFVNFEVIKKGAPHCKKMSLLLYSAWNHWEATEVLAAEWRATGRMVWMSLAERRSELPFRSFYHASQHWSCHLTNRNAIVYYWSLARLCTLPVQEAGGQDMLFTAFN